MSPPRAGPWVTTPASRPTWAASSPGSCPGRRPNRWPTSRRWRTESWTDASGKSQKFPYYDGIPIHRVRAGLLIEAGDWTGTGSGAPPFYVPDEGHGPVNFSQAGRLGMTRPGQRPSGVQFFATYAANPKLNRAFPCFGEIVEGREVIFQLSQQQTYNNGKPIEEIKIRSIRTFEIGNPPPLPEPRQTSWGPKKIQRRDLKSPK